MRRARAIQVMSSHSLRSRHRVVREPASPADVACAAGPCSVRGARPARCRAVPRRSAEAAAGATRARGGRGCARRGSTARSRQARARSTRSALQKPLDASAGACGGIRANGCENPGREHERGSSRREHGRGNTRRSARRPGDLQALRFHRGSAPANARGEPGADSAPTRSQGPRHRP